MDAVLNYQFILLLYYENEQSQHHRHIHKSGKRKF